MVKVEDLRNFVTGNYDNAILSGKTVNGKIELNLKLNYSKIIKDANFIHMYNVDLEELCKNSRELLNYLLEKYLENNTIIGVHYFANVQYHSDKTAIVISGVNNNFTIALRKDCMDLLPDKFMEKIEFSKKNGILKILNKVDVNKFVLHNFDRSIIGRDYRTGLRRDTIDNEVYHYDALRIQDFSGETINYEGEREFVFKMLELLSEKGNVNYDKLKVQDDVFKFGYYNRGHNYQINDKICFNGGTNSDLFVFMEFIDKFVNNYNDEIKDNQMKLVLNRKEW